MRIGKQVCGCETAHDRHNREVWITQCIQHKKEFDMRHAAAAPRGGRATHQVSRMHPNHSETEWQEWLVEAKKRDAAQKAAIAANPNGGCFYRPRVLMVNSGQFWRCAHGLTGWFRWCPRCALRHPILAFRWHFGHYFKFDGGGEHG